MAKYLRTCLTCGKQSREGRDFFEVSASIGPRDICRECAAELGFKNFFSAGIHSNTQILKKYVKLHPEKQYLLDEQMERVAKNRQAIKQEFKDDAAHFRAKRQAAAAEAAKHSGCKKQAQQKCTCKSCGNVYYYSSTDQKINVANALIGNYYTMNQVKDFRQCPKCGSRATEAKTVYFWVDKKGNCVDVEE